jgi:chromosome segregation ATPase
MKEQVPFAKVDVEAGVKAKCSDLVADIGTAALRALLLSHCLEVKHDLVEKKYNNAAEDVEKWKHKSSGLDDRLKEALKDKKATEDALEEIKKAKEAAETERDETKRRWRSLRQLWTREGELWRYTLKTGLGVLRSRCFCSTLTPRWRSLIPLR